MFVEYNPNPHNKKVGDCTIRAISKVLNQDWHKTYWGVVIQGDILGDLPSSNDVWGAYLITKGFKRYPVPNTCPNCYTVRDFCIDNPKGTYLLALASHAVAVIDGNYFDIWDSGDETVFYFWERN